MTTSRSRSRTPVTASRRGRLHRTVLAATAALALVLAACGGTDTAAPAADAGAALPAGTVLIDVRTPEEFDTGHLVGALNLPVELPAFPDQVAELDPDAEYLVYCRSGRRADLAVAYMTELGLDARNVGSVAEAAAETGVAVTG